MSLEEKNVNEKHLQLQEMLLEKKGEKVDPYGLVKKTMNSEEEIQQTPYDSFLFEDSLRMNNSDDIQQIKEKFSSRYNPNTGLYDVTVGDTNTEYYYYATMLNRMTNPVYSQKVYRCATLIGTMMKDFKDVCTSMIEKTRNEAILSSFDYSEEFKTRTAGRKL